MNRTEFMDLHASYAKAMRSYFAEAEKTAAMLAICTVEPLPFEARVRLMSQEIIEGDSHMLYITIKRQLHNAARLGYGRFN